MISSLTTDAVGFVFWHCVAMLTQSIVFNFFPTPTPWQHVLLTRQSHSGMSERCVITHHRPEIYAQIISCYCRDCVYIHSMVTSIPAIQFTLRWMGTKCIPVTASVMSFSGMSGHVKTQVTGILDHLLLIVSPLIRQVRSMLNLPLSNWLG